MSTKYYWFSLLGLFFILLGYTLVFHRNRLELSTKLTSKVNQEWKDFSHYQQQMMFGYRLKPGVQSPYLTPNPQPLIDDTEPRYAVCFICARILRIFGTSYRLMKEIKKRNKNISVYIIIDSLDEDSIRETNHGIYFVALRSSVLFTLGYHSLGDIMNTGWKTQGWDKAMFFFTKIKTEYDFVWFLEHDVFIPSYEAFERVHNKSVIILNDDNFYNRSGSIKKFKYMNPNEQKIKKFQYDMISIFDLPTTIHTGGFGKGIYENYFPSPHMWSLLTSLGLSRRFLNEIPEYIDQVKRFVFLEFYFSNMAKLHNFSILVLPELHTPSLRGKYITCADVEASPWTWFHPVKPATLGDLKSCTYY
jgi:hypothetical protein